MSKLLVVVAVCLCSTGVANADTLVLKDGRTLHGSVSSQDKSWIVFTVEGDGISVKQSFPMEQVARVDEAQPETATSIGATTRANSVYYVIPIRGAIGAEREVRAEWVNEMIEDAKARKVDAIVLDIDSPGGDVTEAEKLLKLIGAIDWAPTIAFVRHGAAEAAVLSSACKHIFMANGGTIGSDLPVAVAQTRPSGTKPLPSSARTPVPARVPARPSGTKPPPSTGPSDLRLEWERVSKGLKLPSTNEASEKARSFWRAEALATAQKNGHDPLLIEGMIDPAAQLSVNKSSGQVQIVKGAGSTIIKQPGQLLSLTAADAVGYGLAEASVANCDEIGAKVALAGWTKCKEGEFIYNRHTQPLIAGRHEYESLTRDLSDAIDLLESKPLAEQVPILTRMLQDLSQLKQLARMCPFLHLNGQAMDDLCREYGERYRTALAASDPRTGLSAGDQRGAALGQRSPGPQEHHCEVVQPTTQPVKPGH